MASPWIEEAKSGRSRCRKCKDAIDKGVLRLGVEVVSNFGESTMWYHLECGASARPVELGAALGAYAGAVPDKDELLQKAASAARDAKPTVFPYAERSPSGRSKCIQCEEKIAKDALRVAVEEEIDTGSFVKKGARYLHAACAKTYTGLDDLLDQLKSHSTSLAAGDLDELARQV